MSAELSEFLKQLEIEDKVLLLSIKPEYSKLIFRGEKTIELRKRFPRFPCKYVLVYESSPNKEITGLFKIKKYHIKNVRDLMELSEKARVTKTFINEYFKGREKGVAIEIEKVFELERKIPLHYLRKEINFTPPQDFKYLRKEEITQLI
jgi:predicted transcriptional regulator